MNAQTELAEPTYTVTDVRMLILADAAKMMDVSVQMLRELVKQGEIGCIPWGNEKRIPVWAIRKWQEKKVMEHDATRKVVSIMDHFPNAPRYRGKR